jgi:hypothetical protein
MDSWFDRWAKRRSTPGTAASSAPDTTSADQSGHSSRRDFLVKAGLVGGAVWTVPAMQSVLAPASAASGTSIGSACTNIGDACGDNTYCGTNGICGGLGATCGAGCFNSSCKNGTCGGSGATCTKNKQCSSKICTSGHCRGKVGAVCHKGSDCQSERCSNAGVCAKGAAGVPCTFNSDCKTGHCNQQSRTCNAAHLGGGCWTNSDCKNTGSSHIHCSQPQSQEPKICGGKGAVCHSDSDCASSASHACKNGHCKA